MPVQVRRGAPFRSMCTAVRAARTRSSKPASRVRLPGGTRNGVRGPGDAPRCGPGRHVRSFTGVAKLATRTAVNRLTAGSNPAPGATTRRPPRRADRAQPSEGRAGSSNLPGETHLVRYASGKRGGCLPPKASSILVRTATTPGYPNQQRTPAQTRCVAGANPVPGTRTNARVAQRKCSRMISGRREVRPLPRARTMFARFSRGGRRDGALPCKQSVAGSTPALSTHQRRQRPRARYTHARLAQLAEVACSNQVRSEFESPGAHRNERADGIRLPILNWNKPRATQLFARFACPCSSTGRAPPAAETAGSIPAGDAIVTTLRSRRAPRARAAGRRLSHA